MERQRGFSLIEVLITAGVIALVAATGVGATMASRSFAVSAAASRFDALLDAARTTARAIDTGATIAFAPDSYGDGFVATLYRNRPSAAPPEATTIPALAARVAVSESATLGKPPFALTVHSDGTTAGIPSYTAGGQAAPETPCPASGSYHLVFSYAGTTADRLIPCTTQLAKTGPVSYTPVQAATIAPAPTAFPCSGSCTPTVPPSPTSNPTCPPGYRTTTVASCVAGGLSVSPTTLTFSAPGTPTSQAFNVVDTSYSGSLQTSDTCSGAITVTPLVEAGPNATYHVAALRPTNCVVSVVDSLGNSGFVQVHVLSSLLKRYVCDPTAPPRPYGIDMGPDSDGKHEDFSDGSSCGQASPTPAPTQTASMSTAHTVSPACVQLFEDDWQCLWTDSYSLPFQSVSGASVKIRGTIATASAIAAVSVQVEYWDGSGYETIAVPVTFEPASQLYVTNATVTIPKSSSANYFLLMTVSCSDSGYAQPQGTQCGDGTNSYTASVS